MYAKMAKIVSKYVHSITRFEAEGTRCRKNDHNCTIEVSPSLVSLTRDALRPRRCSKLSPALMVSSEVRLVAVIVVGVLLNETFNVFFTS